MSNQVRELLNDEHCEVKTHIYPQGTESPAENDAIFIRCVYDFLQRIRAKLWLRKPTSLQQVVCDVIGVHVWIRAGASGQQLPHQYAI